MALIARYRLRFRYRFALCDWRVALYEPLPLRKRLADSALCLSIEVVPVTSTIANLKFRGIFLVRISVRMVLVFADIAGAHLKQIVSLFVDIRWSSRRGHWNSGS